MNKGMLSIGIILLSVIALLLLNVLTNYSTGSELDYYVVKETADSAVSASIDSTAYATCGLIRLDKEKFVEEFLYRFANMVDATRGYKISFYDINEIPPKVSVKVDSLTVLAFRAGMDTESQKVAPEITTSYDAIVESIGEYDVTNMINSAKYSTDQCRSMYFQRYNEKKEGEE